MSAKIYGYARVSSQDQNLERQLEVLRKFGIDDRDIITDKKSGKDFVRDSYQLMKTQLLRAGDTLVIKELDRFGRSYSEMKTEWLELESMGINLVVIDTPILNTEGKSDLERKLLSNIVLEILSYTADKEREKIRQRQKEGIAIARSKKVKFGRPKRELQPEYLPVFKDVLNGTITASSAMRFLDIKRTTFYKLLREYKVTNI